MISVLDLSSLQIFSLIKEQNGTTPATKHLLPRDSSGQSFALVPAVNMNAASATLPQRKTEDYKDHLQPVIAAESAWIENAMPLMRERILNEQAVLWAAYHAKLQPQVLDSPAIIALLPLFFEKSDIPAMIKLGMNIVKEITSYLNPALALSVLQKNAYDSIRGDSSSEEPFDQWRSKMIKKSPTFLYWDIILQIEVFVLIFVRAHREKNFPLCVEALDAFMFMFFCS